MASFSPLWPLYPAPAKVTFARIYDEDELSFETLTIKTKGPSLIDITASARDYVATASIKNGLLHLFLQHTSASLIIQENADPDVGSDLLAFFDRIAPENAPYLHHAEGPDDMPAHIKTALTSNSLMIPFADRRLLLGTWQGIYLFEHRRAQQSRRVIASLIAGL